MDKERVAYSGILLSIAVTGALAFGWIKYSDAINEKITYFLAGNSKENPFCLSWAHCPSEKDTLLASAPKDKVSEDQKISKPTKVVNGSPTATPVPISTPKPESVPMELEERPDPAPVIRIPEIQYGLRPLEDNSYPTPPEIPAIPDPQFKVGELVQWITDNYSAQGQIASLQYDGLWVYEINQKGGSPVSIEENRLSVADLYLPFRASIIGRPIQAYDNLTGEFFGAGVVEDVVLKGDSWEYLIRQGNCGSFEAINARLVIVNKLPMRCITTAQTASFVPVASPTSTPTPTPPEPDRLYEKNDLVRWVVGGGNVHQGKIVDYQLDANNKWVYDISYGDKGSVWQNLDENRILLVTEDTLPYQKRVEGYPVKFINFATGDFLGEGIVEGGEQVGTTWEYDILVATCEVIRPPTGSHLILIAELTNLFDCPDGIGTPVPVPTAEPTPVPTPTPEPDDDSDRDKPTPTEEPTPTSEPTATPEPTPTPTPTQEPPTPTPTSEPPTPTPTPEPEPETPTPTPKPPTPEPTPTEEPEPTEEPTPTEEPDATESPGGGEGGDAEGGAGGSGGAGDSGGG